MLLTYQSYQITYVVQKDKDSSNLPDTELQKKLTNRQNAMQQGKQEPESICYIIKYQQVIQLRTIFFSLGMLIKMTLTGGYVIMAMKGKGSAINIYMTSDDCDTEDLRT